MWGYVRVADIRERELWLDVSAKPIFLKKNGRVFECLELSIGEKKGQVFRYLRMTPENADK